jgi:hypothetical protein
MTSSLRMSPLSWRRVALAALLGTEEEECIMGEYSSFYYSNMDEEEVTAPHYNNSLQECNDDEDKDNNIMM